MSESVRKPLHSTYLPHTNLLVNNQGALRRSPLGATPRFLGWVPGRPRIFPRIKLVFPGGPLVGQIPGYGLYFPVSMGNFKNYLDVRADVVFGAKATQPRKIFRGCQPIEKKTISRLLATSSNIDDSWRCFTATNLVLGRL